MKALGILLAIAGWLVAFLSLGMTQSNGARLVFCVVGIAISLTGILKVLNGAYLKHALWKR